MARKKVCDVDELPVVHVDLRKHPYYSIAEHMNFLCKRWKAEVITFNMSTGNVRVRLIDLETREHVTNLDLSMSYIEESSIKIKIK